jgi:SPP1 gp7 family putative phage head morphogenesis protein
MPKPKLTLCVDLNMENPEVRKALEERVTKIKGTNATLRERLREQLKRGFALGESIDEVAERLRGEFKMQLYRARTIARTEINAAANDARNLQAKKTFGDKYDKEWISANDSLVRPSHQIHGERVRSDKKYSNGLLRPHDPSAPAREVSNCRCTEVYHPDED